jgi:hypothetical protein
MLVLEGFTRVGFLVHGRNESSFDRKEWTDTGHNLDFIFEKEGKVFGAEVKNALPYMRQEELELGLPVDSPKALEQGTMDRFMRWYEKIL